MTQPLTPTPSPELRSRPDEPSPGGFWAVIGVLLMLALLVGALVFLGRSAQETTSPGEERSTPVTTAPAVGGETDG